MRLPVLVPLLCYIVALVLTFLCLFSGHKAGFMEEYAIVRLNTSALGYNLIENTFNFGDEDTNNNDNDNNDDGDNSLIDDLIDGARETIEDIAESVGDIVNDLGNEVAARLARELGISEWYSIHLLTTCQGDFEPNSTVPDAQPNTTACSRATLNDRINITDLLDRELSLGPASLSLSDLGVPDTVNDAADTANDALRAGTILYIVAVAATGLGMLLSAATLAVVGKDPRRMLSVSNLLVAVLAFLVLLVASVLVTVGARRAASEINEHGAVAGLKAEAGEKFITLSWVAFAMVVVATVYYVVELWFAVKARRAGRKRTFGKARV